MTAEVSVNKRNLYSPILQNSLKQIKNEQKPADLSKDTFEKQQETPKENQSLNQEDENNKSIFEKAKNYLTEPINDPKYQQPALVINPNSIPKTTRLKEGIKSIPGLALTGLFAFYLLKVTGVLQGKGNVEKLWSSTTSFQRLEDLALPDSLKETANRLVYKIKNSAEYMAKGGTNKKTILLYGPPGTGKTTFAKAIAQEFEGSIFASIDLGGIKGKYVGETENNLNRVVNRICKQADENPNQKIFVLFDEIDSFAMKDNGSANQQYQASALNTLKKAISEKLSQRNNIITIAATNVDITAKKEGSEFIQQLSGPIVDRFDEKIKVDNPTQAQLRKAIAMHYSKTENVEDCLRDENSKEIKAIAKKLADKNGSFRSLENMYNMAASNSTTSDKLTYKDVLKAIKDVVTSDEAEKIAQPKRILGFAG